MFVLPKLKKTELKLMPSVPAETFYLTLIKNRCRNAFRDTLLD